jgi:peptidoglycan/xylan/chitin deacetylase (PgdA/CDA1 family)
MLAAVNFHYIREDFSTPYKAIHGLTPSSFRFQLEKLGKEGEFVSSNQILDSLNHGKSLPEKSILVTFDDGLKEQYEIALPILEELGVPALFYINPYNIAESKVSNVHQIHLLRSHIESSEILFVLNKIGLDLSLTCSEEEKAVSHYNYDSPDDAIIKYILNFKLNYELRDEVVNSLFEDFFSLTERLNFHSSLYMDNSMVKQLSLHDYLGSHTYSHQPLGMLNSDKLLEEFLKSDEFFKNNKLPLPKSISYPYGSKDSCSKEVLELAKSYQFSFGFTMERAGNKNIFDRSLQLARFDCNDVVGGKSSLFDIGEMFEKMPMLDWSFE